MSRSLQQNTIKGVDPFAAELQVLTFCEMKFFAHTEIGFCKARAPKGADPAVAECSGDRLSEVAIVDVVAIASDARRVCGRSITDEPKMVGCETQLARALRALVPEASEADSVRGKPPWTLTMPFNCQPPMTK